MPSCGCFHNFNLATLGDGQYQAEFDLQGYVDFPQTFRVAGIANRIMKHTSQPIYRLLDVSDFRKLENLCTFLRSKIVVDLSPDIDFCYALGPYMLFDEDDTPSRSKIGEMLYVAKYQRNREVAGELNLSLLNFIQSHPILSGSTAISFPPKSQSELPDIVGTWGRNIANYLDWDIITSTKIRSTPPQKDLGEGVSESDAVERVMDSIAVFNVPSNSKVLVLDDTIRSGGSLLELARALRQAGASSVYGLAAAKDAKFTRGGVNLYRDVWS